MRFDMISNKQVLFIALISFTFQQLISQIILKENFETYKPNAKLHGKRGWFTKNQDKLNGLIVKNSGVKGSKALSIWSENLHIANGFYHKKIGNNIKDTFWLTCKFRLGDINKGKFYIALRDDKIYHELFFVERIYKNKKGGGYQLMGRTPYEYSGARIYYSPAYQKKHWYTLVAKIDLKKQTKSVWFEDQVVAERQPYKINKISQIYIGAEGSKASPAFIDNILITKSPIKGVEERKWLPKKKKGLISRLAVIGDPQPGLGGMKGYDRHIYQFRTVMNQVIEADSDAMMIVGDFVHEDKHEKSYQDISEICKLFKGQFIPVRGNHDDIELYKKYFCPDLDYTIEHKGVKYIIIDSIGGKAELSDQQLDFLHEECEKAKKKKQWIMVGTHVSPWQDNVRGGSPYMQMGFGREPFMKILEQNEVQFHHAGHYHRGPWHKEINSVNYFVHPGTGLSKYGILGFMIFDIYKDRVEAYVKPLHVGYEPPNSKRYYDFAYSKHNDYKTVKKDWPYMVHGPMVIEKKLR